MNLQSRRFRRRTTFEWCIYIWHVSTTMTTEAENKRERQTLKCISTFWFQSAYRKRAPFNKAKRCSFVHDRIFGARRSSSPQPIPFHEMPTAYRFNGSIFRVFYLFIPIFLDSSCVCVYLSFTVFFFVLSFEVESISWVRKKRRNARATQRFIKSKSRKSIVSLCCERVFGDNRCISHPLALFP